MGKSDWHVSLRIVAMNRTEKWFLKWTIRYESYRMSHTVWLKPYDSKKKVNSKSAIPFPGGHLVQIPLGAMNRRRPSGRRIPLLKNCSCFTWANLNNFLQTVHLNNIWNRQNNPLIRFCRIIWRYAKTYCYLICAKEQYNVQWSASSRDHLDRILHEAA